MGDPPHMFLVMSHILLGIALDRKKFFTFIQVFIQSIWENQVLQFFPWAL